MSSRARLGGITADSVLREDCALWVSALRTGLLWVSCGRGQKYEKEERCSDRFILDPDWYRGPVMRRAGGVDCASIAAITKPIIVRLWTSPRERKCKSLKKIGGGKGLPQKGVICRMVSIRMQLSKRGSEPHWFNEYCWFRGIIQCLETCNWYAIFVGLVQTNLVKLERRLITTESQSTFTLDNVY